MQRSTADEDRPDQTGGNVDFNANRGSAAEVDNVRGCRCGVSQGRPSGCQTRTVTEGQPRVTAEDRARFARQVSALQPAESDDEGTPGWRAQRIEEIDAYRAAHGIPPLKTEPELHRRARDLGLLRR